ncbi:Peptidyl-prolyl isomerase cwc27 [Pseudocyphellaria aurata]|nr:Peptidyl-prolyl isomerase cwc27 [Pseudocyphellaria aurata]
MSSLYNLEPQPTAQVLLETTSGEILLELFAKQTPLTSRNFLQLCLDGYYNGTIFHRLVPGFVIQGGDPTGTGDGGEASYDGGLFEDEFHSRLKFNRRGLLGMANSGRKNDNGSQFFLTLGATSELEGRNTMFGRVAGDTIYNLMKMGEAELAETGGEKPLYPTRITGAEVLVNPFADMVRREGRGKGDIGVTRENKIEKKKGRKKGGKTLLSFGVEEGEEGVELPMAKREKLNSKPVNAEANASALKETKESTNSAGKSTEKAFRRKRSRSRSPMAIEKPEREVQLPLPNEETPSRSPSLSPEAPIVGKVSTLLERTNAQIADMKASMKRNIPSAPKEEFRKKSALEQMIPENATRGRKRRHGVNGNVSKDAKALEILDAFRAKLENAPPENGPSQSPSDGLSNAHDPTTGNGDAEAGPDEEADLCDLHFIANCQSCQSWDKHLSEIVNTEEEDGKGWMSHALNFDKDRLGKDLNWKRKNEDDLVVIDPREKEKDIMEEHRAKKVARSNGNVDRAWDKDRERGRLPERRAREKR